jgi:hypothetical protein
VISIFSHVSHAVAWSAFYTLIILGVLLCLLALATFVALFAQDEKRANRALRVFRELITLLRRPPR